MDAIYPLTEAEWSDAVSAVQVPGPEGLSVALPSIKKGKLRGLRLRILQYFADETSITPIPQAPPAPVTAASPVKEEPQLGVGTEESKGVVWAIKAGLEQWWKAFGLRR